MHHRHVDVEDLGRIPYASALQIQHELLDELVSLKKVNKSRDLTERQAPNHHYLFCEHDPVFTLGRTGKMNHLLLNSEQLHNESIEFYKTNRGGDITFHGPGQIVGYPIFDLEYFFTDVHKFVRYIEEGIIRTLKLYGIRGKRISGYTGVWLDATQSLPERKICAIGIHLSRWISMHGFAFNVNTDLSYFSKIIPCGISDGNKDVTSLAREIGESVDLIKLKSQILQHYAEIFDFEYTVLKPLQP